MTETGPEHPDPSGDPGPPGSEHLHPLRERLREDLEVLERAAIEAELETGRREETIHEAKVHVVWRMGRITAGIVVVMVGLALLPLPGPGWLTIALGLGILSRDVPFAQRMLDRVRTRLPQDADGRIPRSAIAVMVISGIAFTAGSLWFTFMR